MRTLTDHIVNPANDKLEVYALDEPGSGGAHHLYGIQIPGGPLAALGLERASFVISYQDGPIAERGINGITEASLLAILIDRLRCFQAGPLSCRENAIALTKLEEALMWLHKRTRDRLARGVEGTSQK